MTLNDGMVVILRYSTEFGSDVSAYRWYLAREFDLTMNDAL